jgi:hypothetical protein
LFKNTAFYDKSGGENGILAPETAEIVNFSIFFNFIFWRKKTVAKQKKKTAKKKKKK